MIRLSTLCITLLSVLASCRPDTEITLASQFTYKGKNYALAKAYVENYGKYNAGTGFAADLTFHSESLTVKESKGRVVSADGIGDVIVFEIFTTDSLSIPTGQYVYDSFFTGRERSFDFGKVFINISFQTQPEEQFELNAGVVDVTHLGGDNYEIKIDCQNKAGEKVSGYYNGKIKHYNYEAL